MVDDRAPEDPLTAAVAQPLSHPPDHWLEPLYREHATAVLQAAYRITGNLHDAEDVLQTVFARLAGRSRPPDLTGGGRPYLKRAAINAALDLIASRRGRSAARPLGELAEGPPDPAPTPDRLQESRELAGRIRRALAGLNRRSAEMFALRYFEGLDNRSIAEQLATSPATVAVTLHRTRALLQQALRSPSGGLP